MLLSLGALTTVPFPEGGSCPKMPLCSLTLCLLGLRMAWPGCTGSIHWPSWGSCCELSTVLGCRELGGPGPPKHTQSWPTSQDREVDAVWVQPLHGGCPAKPEDGPATFHPTNGGCCRESLSGLALSQRRERGDWGWDTFQLLACPCLLPLPP